MNKQERTPDPRPSPITNGHGFRLNKLIYAQWIRKYAHVLLKKEIGSTQLANSPPTLTLPVHQAGSRMTTTCVQFPLSYFLFQLSELGLKKRQRTVCIHIHVTSRLIGRHIHLQTLQPLVSTVLQCVGTPQNRREMMYSFFCTY